MDGSCPAGNIPSQSTSPHGPSHITKQSSGSCKVRRNHPWMAIVHPGPWTQLPPTKPPVTPPATWYRPRVTPPNPFGEVENEDVKDDNEVDGAKTTANTSTPSKETSTPDNEARNPNESINTHSLSIVPEPNIVGSGGLVCLPDIIGCGPTVPEPIGAASGCDVLDIAGKPNTTDVPAFSETDGSDGATCLAGETLDRDLATAANSLEMELLSSLANAGGLEALTVPTDLPETLTIRGALAPVYGIPLIKRKVQTDPYVPSKDLDAERNELKKQLEVLEQRCVEMESKLRCCVDEKEEEKMFMDCLIIVHEKHLLTRQDAELVYLEKQRDLEQRQANVEYELRCLLNKPEKEWSQGDRVKERQLTDKKVTVIEQRNQIINSLDQDRQREREEDNMLEVIKNCKDLQKAGWKELKKTKGNLKAMEVFKVLFNKAEFAKDVVDKKS